MSGAGTPFAFGAVSALDRTTIIHRPGQAPEYIYPPDTDIAAEAERLAAHRAQAEAAEAERVKAADHASRVGARVKAFIDAAGDRPAGISARAWLLEHHARISSAEQMQAAASRRLAEVAHAKVRFDAAVAALAEVEQKVSDAFSSWIRFGSEGLPPDDRTADRAILATARDDAEPMAKLAEAAQFETDVAAACVTALQAQLPDLRSDVLVEGPATVIGKRIRATIASLETDYGTLASLRTVVARHGQSLPLPVPGSVLLPAVPGGPRMTMDVRSDGAGIALWNAAVEALVNNPASEIAAPDNQPRPPPAPVRGRFFSRKG